jgi:[ribosomal protein S5]-alanine N-acetyltransferase
MLEINFNPFPVITTERLLLRQITLDDVTEVFRMRSDEKASQYIARPLAKTIEEAEAHINKLTKGVADNEIIAWGITLKGETKICGAICFLRMQKENYRSEIGAEMLREYWGRGIVLEAMIPVIAYGFSIMKLHSIEARLHPDNTASRRVLEKAGFVKEAHFKEDYFHNGKFGDTAVYSLLNTGKNMTLSS